jgi:hypothetical protein
LTVFEVYWLRGVLYIAIGVALEITFSQAGNPLCVVYGVSNILDGICYVVAHIRGQYLKTRPRPRLLLLPCLAHHGVSVGWHHFFLPGANRVKTDCLLGDASPHGVPTGETHTAADNSAAGLGVNTTKLKTKVAATAMGIV